mgnify:CR=1 FL=1
MDSTVTYLVLEGLLPSSGGRSGSGIFVGGSAPPGGSLGGGGPEGRAGESVRALSLSTLIIMLSS